MRKSQNDSQTLLTIAVGGKETVRAHNDFVTKTSSTTIEKDCFFLYKHSFQEYKPFKFSKVFNGSACWDSLDGTSHNSNKSITRTIVLKLLFNYVKISIRFFSKIVIDYYCS